MDLARFAIEKRLVSAIATLLILVSGYFAYTALPRLKIPNSSSAKRRSSRPTPVPAPKRSQRK
jgi:hypothetical protein